MSLSNLDNLVKTGQLKVEPMNQLEFSGLLRSGEARLHDPANPSLAAESQFDLAYNAATRYLLPHYVGMDINRVIAIWCFRYYLIPLGLAHKFGACWQNVMIVAMLPNTKDYFEMDEQLLKDLLTATQILLARVRSLK